MAKRKAPTATPTSEPPRKTRPTHLEPDVEHEESPESPPSSTLSPGAELDGSLRVLRAVEQIVVDGGDTVETTEDFTVQVPISYVTNERRFQLAFSKFQTFWLPWRTRMKMS